MMFVTKLNGKNWTPIDSFYISDQNLTMIFEWKKALRKMKLVTLYIWNTCIILVYKMLNKTRDSKKVDFCNMLITHFHICLLTLVLLHLS